MNRRLLTSRPYSDVGRFQGLWLSKNVVVRRIPQLIVALNKNSEASKACCHEQPGPFADDPGIFGPGGGKVGAIILSPLVEPGTVNQSEFNHYALLRSIEDMFAL